MPRAAAGARREELRATAARLFAERGFAGVTVDDIGAAVGVSGPALYHHFKSKEALLGETLVAISQELLREAEAIVQAVHDPRAALRALVAAHARFAVEHPELITVQFRDLVHASPDDARAVRRLQRRYVDAWVGTVERAQAGADGRATRAAVHAALGLLNSTPYSGRLRRDEMQALLAAMANAALVAVGP